MMIETGMRVSINVRSTSYKGKYVGMGGYVVKCDRSSGKVAVLLDDVKNSASAYGAYWFKRDELHQEVQKEVKMPPKNDEIATLTYTFACKVDVAPKKKTHRDRDPVDHVLHNPPATIVFWKDKTKTVVKQQDGDVYDPEKGFMAACAKKFFGNDNQFNYEIKWYVTKPEQADTKTINPSEDADRIEAENLEDSAELKGFRNIVLGEEYTGPTC